MNLVISTCTYMRMYVYTYHVCIHTYTHTYILIYIRTYVHTYIHIYLKSHRVCWSSRFIGMHLRGCSNVQCLYSLSPLRRGSADESTIDYTSSLVWVYDHIEMLLVVEGRVPCSCRMTLSITFKFRVHVVCILQELLTLAHPSHGELSFKSCLFRAACTLRSGTNSPPPPSFLKAFTRDMLWDTLIRVFSPSLGSLYGRFHRLLQ